MTALFAVIIIALGVVTIISPRTGWQMSEGWKFKDAEPSEAALVWMRVSGVICVLFGLWVLFTG